MESSNPVLRGAPEFKRGGYAGFDSRPAPGAQWGVQPSLEDMYAAPSATPAQTGRMTYDDVLVRAGVLLATVVAGAAVGWYVPGLTIVGLLGGLVLGLVNSLKRSPSPVLMLGYAVFEGLFLGGISAALEARYFGIVVQAVLATVITFGVMLALYRSGAIRATPRFRRVLLGAMLGYAVFCLVNLVFAFFGAGLGVWSGGVGLLVGAVGTVLASLSLVLDFDVIDQGVRNGLPQRYAWTAAFGLIVSLVWLYIEFLRILSVLRSLVSE